MSRVDVFRIAVSVAAVLHSAKAADALVEIVSTEPSMAAQGWIAPGGGVSLSTRVTANVVGVPNVRVGYVLIHRSTGQEVAGKSGNFTLRPGAPVDLAVTIPIPASAPQGKYRAELRVTGASGVVFWREPRAVCVTVTKSLPQSDGVAIPVRGCSELPASGVDPAANYVHSSGSQLVDVSGTPVRIFAVGWPGTEGHAGYGSAGLWTLNYRRVMEAFRSEGFNAIRIPWTDAILHERPSQQAAFIDADFRSNNAELRDPAFAADASGYSTYKKTIDIFQHYADYAAQIGLKIIFEHHSNRGYTGQQQNGLWFSKDIDRNYCSDGQYIEGVDGPGGAPGATFGRCDSPDSAPSKYVDYDTFKRHWIELAARFAGHPAVLGFELHNEPLNMWSPCPATGPWVWCAPVQINWGATNDKYDIKWMAQDVGDAIHAVNPNALIIVEAAFAGYNGSPTPGWVRRDKPPGTDPKVSAADGDLTAVSVAPVTLKRAHRLSYSVHLYPAEIVGSDSSADYSGRYWMNEFGHVFARNIAPVLVTETGACVAAGHTSADAKRFLAGVLPFLNGHGAPGRGPSLYANRQGIGVDWWPGPVNGSPADCTTADRNPNGVWKAWPPGNFVPFRLNRPETLAYTDQLRFRGAGDVSPDNTVVGAGGSIVDAGLNVWAVRDGTVTFNGDVDVMTADAKTIAQAGGRVCYRSSSGGWYCRSGGSWAAAPSPLRLSPEGFVSTSGGPPVVDASGNFWSLAAGRVMINGDADDSPALVTQIAYQGGRIWRMNEAGAWSSRNAPSAPWSAAASSPLSPAVAARIITEGCGAIIDANRNSWSVVDGVVVVNGVADSNTANVVELVYAGGRIWRKDASMSWWSKALPADVWSPAGGQPSGPDIAPSPRGTVVGPGGAIVTTARQDWILSGGRVVVDGVVDGTTDDVVKLAYDGEKVWRQNADGLWQSKAALFAGWGPPGGTTAAPF